MATSSVPCFFFLGGGGVGGEREGREGRVGKGVARCHDHAIPSAF